MSGVKELAYVVYEASDLADWEHFGVDLMGMALGEKSDGQLTLRLDQKVHRWIITHGPADDLAASGYEVTSDADLDEIAARLTAGGYECTVGDADLAAARKVERILITADPMGNRVELVTGLADAATPFQSTVLQSQFKTGLGGAGHHVVLAKGVSREEYMAFYQGALGFKISDYIVEELAPGLVADLIFLHCNPRHHTLAMGDMPHPKKTHHFMLEVMDIRDVGYAWDRCLKDGQPFEMTLGQHPNDNMFSFYVKTPSGFAIEYGWGGVLIEDDATWQVQTFDCLNNWGHHPPEFERDALIKSTSADGSVTEATGTASGGAPQATAPAGA
jgi:2,3-dihydroxybiphenyl 1,2-dioxygenase